jgi:putrescine importer
VNLSAFMRYFVRSERKTFLNLVPPLLGFLICFYIWLSLRTPAKCAGFAWLASGLLYGAYKTNWFARTLECVAPDEERAAKPSHSESPTGHPQP